MFRKPSCALGLLVLVAILVLLVTACSPKATATPTPAPTNTPTTAPTPTPAPTATTAAATATTAAPTATPTKAPVATPTPTATLPPAQAEAPAPKNPKGTMTIGVAAQGVEAGVGLGSAQAPIEAMAYWGAGDDLFTAKWNADGSTDFRVPKVAESYDVAPDFSYATIKIRQGIKFHKDNGELTADDVVFTLNDANAAVNPASIHGQAGDYAAQFKAWEKIDQYTVKVPFSNYDLRWNAHFLNDAAQGTVFFSKTLYDTKGPDWMRENMISTGAFQVNEWKRNDKAILDKVPYKHFWKDAQVQQMRVLEMPEEPSRIAALKTGEIDIAVVSLKQIKALTTAGFKADQISGRSSILSIFYSGNYWETKHAKTGATLERQGYCNNDLPWVSWVGCGAADAADQEEARNVRQALAYSIDRPLLVKTVLDGFGTPASQEYVDTTATYYQKRWDWPYDPAKAKELMAKTAWPEGNFTINIWTGNESPGINAEINDAIAGMWKTLWPKMDIQVFKSAYAIIRPGLVGRTNTIPYAGDADEGATTIPFDWPKGLTETSMTRGGFGGSIEIPKIAETYLKVAKEPDIAKRIQLNTELIDYLHNEAVIVGNVQVPNMLAYNPKSIKEWKGWPAIFAEYNGFVNIVPADR